MVRSIGRICAVVLVSGVMLPWNSRDSPSTVDRRPSVDNSRPARSQATASGRAEPGRQPCKPDDPCCPSAHAGFSYAAPTPPKLLKRVEPDLATVAKPYPCGVAILEIGVNERGTVVSSCVLRSVRSDFDRAAQIATRKWEFRLVPYRETGTTPPSDRLIPVVMTVTVMAPARDCSQR